MTDIRNKTSSPPLTKTIEQLLERGETAFVVTLLAGPGAVGAKLLVQTEGTTVGTLGEAELDSIAVHQGERFMASRDETRMFTVSEFAPVSTLAHETVLLYERLQPPPRMVICGAGHVGASLAKLAAFTGYQTTLIDDRPEFLQRDRFPESEINLIVAGDWISSVREAIGHGRGVSVAVVTRGHKEDEQCMRAVVPARPDYVGLIGSKRRTRIVIERLRESGIADELLGNIHAPIGLDIGAVTPEEVALAIMAEVVARRRGGSGAPLSALRRR